MRRLFYNPSLVLLLFLGITAGNALPYAELYQVKTAKTFSCHCCDHGKVDCPHCARFGHRNGLQALKTGAKSRQPVLKNVPCSTSRENPKSLNFSLEPFVLVQVRPILLRPRLLPIREESDDLLRPDETPETPPPQYTA